MKQILIDPGLRQLEYDARVMALRLMGANENTFSAECQEVMRRWKPKMLKIIEDNNGPTKRPKTNAKSEKSKIG